MGGGGEAAANKVQAPLLERPRAGRFCQTRARSEVREARERLAARGDPGHGARGGSGGTSTQCPRVPRPVRRAGRPAPERVHLDLRLWFLLRLRWILRRQGTEQPGAPGARRATWNWASAGTSPAATGFSVTRESAGPSSPLERSCKNRLMPLKTFVLEASLKGLASF